MADEFKEVTNISYADRISSSFKGVIFGLALFLGAFPLQWWNEGRSVDRIKTLDEGRGAVIPISSQAVDVQNNGKLIYFTGTAGTNDILKDDIFGVSENALKLMRTVEIYQWKESKETKTHDKIGGGQTEETVYTYNQGWHEGLIDSNGFKEKAGHENPASMPFRSEVFKAGEVKVGAFRLTDELVGKINDYKGYNLTQANYDLMNPGLKGSLKLEGTQYIYGSSAWRKVGSIRVKFSIMRPLPVSVIGKQNNDSVETYPTQRGEIALIEKGTVAAQSMFAHEENKNTMITWAIRVGGFLMMWWGLSLIVGPIYTLAKIIPFLGDLVEIGFGAVAWMIALVMSALTISFAWIYYRPLIGGGLLVIVAGLIYLIIKRVKSKKAAIASATQNKPMQPPSIV